MWLSPFPSNTLIHFILFHIPVSALVVICTQHIYILMCTHVHTHTDYTHTLPSMVSTEIFYLCSAVVFVLNLLFLPIKGFACAEIILGACCFFNQDWNQHEIVCYKCICVQVRVRACVCAHCVYVCALQFFCVLTVFCPLCPETHTVSVTLLSDCNCVCVRARV